MPTSKCWDILELALGALNPHLSALIQHMGVEILWHWLPGTDKQRTTVVVREVATKAL